MREWPYAKLQGWILYDETTAMLSRTRAGLRDAPEDMILDAVIDEQERCGWVGIYKAVDDG